MIVTCGNRVYTSMRQAARDLSGYVPIRKVKANGIENKGIYIFNDRILKFTLSTKEAEACSKLIGKKFRNVVQVFAVHRIIMKHWKDGKKYVVYAIEQERLKRDRSVQFSNLDVEKLLINMAIKSKCRSIFPAKLIVDSVLNAYVELESVGIIYRDLHSDNMMRDTAGNLKLIDFGFVTVRRNVN